MCSDGIQIEIEEIKGDDSKQNEMEKDTKQPSVKKTLFHVVMKGDMKAVVKLYKTDRAVQKEKITRSGDTALHIVISNGEEDIVEQLVSAIGKEKDAVATLNIANEQGNTALHFAASVGNKRMCEYIVNSNNKPKELLSARNKEGETPFFWAALYGKKEAFLSLYEAYGKDAGSECYRRNNGDTILHCAIAGEHFDLAYQIILLYKELSNSFNEDGITPLHLLASKPSAFKSGSHLRGWNKLIYHCIYIDDLQQQKQQKESPMIKTYDEEKKPKHPENYQTCVNLYRLVKRAFEVIGRQWKEKTTNNHQNTDGIGDSGPSDPKNPKKQSHGDNGIRARQIFPDNYNTIIEFVKLAYKAIQIVFGKGSREINKIIEKKEKHRWSVQIVDQLLEHLSLYEYDNTGENPQQTVVPRVSNAMLLKFSELQQQDKKDNTEKKETPILLAAKNGILEIVDRILKHFPVAIHDKDSEKKNAVLLAVEHRQPQVYQFLLKSKIANETVFQCVDRERNSALHLAATLGGYGPWLIPGAALQMQWERKWYEFVKNSKPLHYFFRYNAKNESPNDVFMRTHRELIRDGSEWLSKTSESCSVVSTLVATVAFATSATVPGGVKQDKGTPVLENHPAFDVFAIASLVALCFSVTSVVMFLAILTSRYQERDFRRDLPVKLLLGLTSLFVGIAAMLVSFCAGHFFVLQEKLKYAALPVYIVTCLPITLFAIAQFPLYFDLIWAILKTVPQRSYKKNEKGTQMPQWYQRLQELAIVEGPKFVK
ncbi:PGG domain [Dillenia turbinata]|uniref:PGG domain n=1 Tax=Dillenia turbinata TaxID=194707 RepID=A0AAN8VZW9_9MAGN